MRATGTVWLVGGALLLASASDAAGRGAPVEPSEARSSRVTRAVLDRLSLHFEPNLGQVEPKARFIARARTYDVVLTDRSLVVAPLGSADAVTMEFADASERPRMVATGRMPGRSNYFHGTDPARWVTDVPHFGSLETREIAPGMDLRLRGTGEQLLQYELVVAPGADPAEISLRFSGIDSLRIDERGELALGASSGQLRHTRPILYQEFDGSRRRVVGGFELREDRSVGFRVGEYDPAFPLIIDPEIRYSTYHGSSTSRDWPSDIAVDSQGAAFVTGQVRGTGFPTASPYQGSNASTGGNFVPDAFLMKVNASGTALVYSTYLGGSSDDYGEGVVVDANGDAVIAGSTNSSDFPTSSARQGSLAGNFDVFLTKFNATGSALTFSTYHGGSAGDLVTPNCLAIDAQGALYLTGSTNSTDLPTASAIYSSKQASSSNSEIFVSKFAANGASLSYSTYYAGTNGGSGHSKIAVDSDSRAVVVGMMLATDFPTDDPIQSSNAGSGDTVVFKLNAAGSATVFATYLGGSGSDRPWAVGVDDDDDIYVLGQTVSTDFPTTSGVVQTSSTGLTLTKIEADGSDLVYSTYLDGGDPSPSSSGNNECDLAVDGSGNAYVAAATTATDFDTVDPIEDGDANAGSWDVTVQRINTTGTSTVFATYLGGTDFERARAIALEASGSIYVTGRTGSSDFPLESPIQAQYTDLNDAFVTKIGPSIPPAIPTGLSATVLSETEVSLSWTDADLLETAFEVERAVGAGAFAELVGLGANSESFDDTTVEGSTTYRYRVRAVNDVGPSDWSGVATATTPSPPPGGVEAALSGPYSITITWSDDADDETGYVVERAEGCPGETFSVIAVLPADSTSFTDLAVSPETTYSYRVRTRGSSADSTPSLEVCATTAPYEPTAMTAFAVHDTHVLLRWSDRSSIETGFEIERGVGCPPTTWASIAQLEGSVIEHADLTVGAETEYSYRIRTLSDSGPSPWSAPACVETPPARPTLPFGEGLTPSSVRITWTDSSSAESGYEVRRSLHGEDDFRLAARLPRDSTELVDTGLQQETSYDYTIQAYGAAGKSAPAGVVDLATPAVLVIRKVTLKGAKKKKPASMKVDADIDFGGYQPQASDGGGVGVNGATFDVGTMTEKAGGKKLSGAGEGFSFQVKRSSSTASRGRLKLTVTGGAAEIAGDGPLTISFRTGEFSAAGSIELSGGKFILKKRRGVRLDPDVIPGQLSLRLSGIEKDRLTVTASFQAPRPVPDEQPHAVIQVGDATIAFDGGTATVKGSKVTYRLEDEVARGTVVVDYAKGTLKVKASRIELGDYEKGNVSTLLDIAIGELRWRDVPVLRSSGRSAKY